MGWVRSNLNAVRRLRARLADRLYRLYLPSGEVISYDTEDLLDALGASLAREPHPLRSAINETDLDTGLEGLIRALDRSYAEVDEEE